MVRNNIKTMRKKNTIYNQEEAAKKLKFSLDAYRNYEQGRRQPKPHILKQIAELFNCSVDELI